jgi:hypothetical protein
MIMEVLPQDRFIEAAKEHGQGIVEGEPQKTNRAYDRVVAAIRDLRKSPDKGEEFLMGLLDKEDLALVRAAATYLLPLREVEAVQALERVTKDGLPLIAFGAEMALKEWRAGRLKVD